MFEDHPMIRQFLRREEEERVVHERRYPPTLWVVAYRIFNEALNDPAIRVKRSGPIEADGGADGFEGSMRLGAVPVGYQQEEEMIVAGMALIEHEGLGGLRLVMRLGREDHSREMLLEITIREEDRSRLEGIEEWLDGLLEGNHPLKGHLLELTEEGLAFLPQQGVTRQDIVLPEDILEEMERNFGFLMARGSRPEALRHRAVLLAGIPGVGKTLLCRWLAEQVTGTVLWVTPGTVWRVGPSSVFTLARMLRPALVVLEDLDVSAGTRDGNQPLGELLTQMDGFVPLTDIGIVATTNHPEVLDHAIDPRTRPGRFHRMILVEPPSRELQHELLRRLLTSSTVLPDQLVEYIPTIVEAVPDETGARLATLVSELEHRWIWERHNGRQPDFEQLVKEVTGRESPGRTPFGFAAGAA